MSNATEFTSWEDMTTLDQYQCIFWDMYKDAWGVRPRFVDTSSWTEEQFVQEFAYLENLIAANMEAEKENQLVSINNFEKLVSDTITIGAKDRTTALRWIIDGEYDIGYVEYNYGLPYGYLKEAA